MADNWNVGLDGDVWIGNVTFSNTTAVQATNCVELRQKVDDYVSYWRFDENGGMLVADENTANANTGTLVNFPDWVSGKYGSALKFTYAGDKYVSITDSDELDITDGISKTIAFWVKTSAPATQFVLGKYNGALGYWGLRVLSNGYPYFYMRDTNPNTGVIVGTGAGKINDNEWHHLTVIVDRSVNRAKMFIDGNEAGSAVISNVQDMSNKQPLLFGGYSTTSTSDSELDDIRIYNRALTTTEIAKVKDNEHFPAGSLTSTSKDAGSGYIWEVISFGGNVPSGANVTILFSSSDDGVTYGDYDLVESSALVDTNYTIPFADQKRYGSWRLELKGGSVTPEIYNVTLYSAIAGGDRPPTVSLNYPANNHVSKTRTITFNCSASDDNDLSNISLYGNWSGGWHLNETMPLTGTSNSAAFTRTLPEGDYEWNCEAVDNASNSDLANENFTFGVDLTKPGITVVSPLNSTYPTTSITFEVSLDERGEWCGYSLDGAANMTMTKYDSTSFKLTNSSMTNTSHYVKFWCNDTAGNADETPLIHFTVSVKGTSANETDGVWVNETEDGVWNITLTDDITLIVDSSGNNLADWYYQGINYGGAGNANHKNRGLYYNEIYLFGDDYLLLDAITHSGTESSIDLVYNDSEIAIFKGEDNHTGEELLTVWYFFMWRNNPYVLQKEIKQVRATGRLSNNQMVNFWKWSLLDHENETDYDGSHVYDSNRHKPLFSHLDFGDVEEFHGVAFSNSSTNFTAGHIFTGVDEYQHRLVSAKNIPSPGSLSSDWVEPQENYFGQMDNSMFYLDMLNRNFWIEQYYFAENGTAQSVIFDRGKDMVSGYYEKAVPYTIFSAETGSDSIVGRDFYTTNNWLMSYTSGLWYLPLHSRMNRMDEDLYFDNSTNLKEIINPFISDASRLEVERSRESDERWTRAVFNVRGMFNITKKHTVYNDSDKVVYEINLTPRSSLNLSKIYFEFSSTAAREIVKVDDNITDVRWDDNNLGTFGLSFINKGGFTIKKYSPTKVRLYLLDENSDTEYNPTTTWSGMFWMYPHEGEITDASDITSLNSMPTEHMRIYYRTLNGLEGNKNYGIKPNDEIFDYKAAVEGTSLRFSAWAETGYHTMMIFVNKSNVIDVKQDDVSLNPDSWSFNTSSRVLEMNTYWSGTSNFKVLYEEGTDTIPPTIIIHKPLNKSINNDSFHFAYGDIVNWTAYSVDDGANTSNAFVSEWTGILAGLSDGSHKIKVYAYDPAGNMNSMTRYWTRDTIPPTVTFMPPTPHNEIITTNYAYINITLSETDDNCSLEWDGVNAGMGRSGLNLHKNITDQANGNRTFLAHCYDTAGNLKDSETRWVYMNYTEVDKTSPEINIISPLNSTYYSNNAVWFNVTLNEAGSACLVQMLGINYTLTNSGGNWNYLIDTLSDGAYAARFFCNDTSGNMKGTESIFFFIDTKSPQISFTHPTPQNGSNLDVNYIYINISYTEANRDEVIFNWDGSNNTVVFSCASTFCYYNKTYIANEIHTYYVGMSDLAGNYNQTETRNVTINATTQSGCVPSSCSPPTSRNWVVNESCTCSNMEIVMNGDVVVDGEARGRLYLDNATFKMNQPSSYQHSFTVESGADLYAHECVFDDNVGKYKFYFYVDGNSTVKNSVFGDGVYIYYRGSSSSSWYDTATKYIVRSADDSLLFWDNVTNAFVVYTFHRTRATFKDSDIRYFNPVIESANTIIFRDFKAQNSIKQNKYWNSLTTPYFINLSNTEVSYFRPVNDGNLTLINVTLNTFYQRKCGYLTGCANSGRVYFGMDDTFSVVKNSSFPFIRLDDTHEIIFQGPYSTIRSVLVDENPTISGYVDMPSGVSWELGAEVKRVFPGLVYYEGTAEPVENANVTVEKNGSHIDSDQTDANGSWEIEITFDSVNYDEKREIYVNGVFRGYISFLNDTHPNGIILNVPAV